MDRKDCHRATADRRLDGAEIHVVVGIRDVDGYRDGTDLTDRLPCCDERHRRHDDFPAAAYVEGGESQAKGIQTARYADRCASAAIPGELSLECSDGLTVDKGRRSEQRVELFGEEIEKGSVDTRKIEKRDVCVRLGDWRGHPRIVISNESATVRVDAQPRKEAVALCNGLVWNRRVNRYDSASREGPIPGSACRPGDFVVTTDRSHIMAQVEPAGFGGAN